MMHYRTSASRPPTCGAPLVEAQILMRERLDIPPDLDPVEKALAANRIRGSPYR